MPEIGRTRVGGHGLSDDVTVSGGAFRQVDQDRRVRGVQRADGVAHRAGAVRGVVGAERDRGHVVGRVRDGRGRGVHVLLDGRRHQSGDRHRHVSGAWGPGGFVGDAVPND